MISRLWLPLKTRTLQTRRSCWRNDDCPQLFGVVRNGRWYRRTTCDGAKHLQICGPVCMFGQRQFLVLRTNLALTKLFELFCVSATIQSYAKAMFNQGRQRTHSISNSLHFFRDFHCETEAPWTDVYGKLLIGSVRLKPLSFVTPACLLLITNNSVHGCRIFKLA